MRRCPHQLRFAAFRRVTHITTWTEPFVTVAHFPTEAEAEAWVFEEVVNNCALLPPHKNNREAVCPDCLTDFSY